MVRAQYGRDFPAEPHAGRDGHPARLFLRFLTDRREKRAMEVIWGNRLRAGDYKYIRGFSHFVANGGDDRVGRWLNERIDLAAIYAEVWNGCGAGARGRCRRILRQRRRAHRQHQVLRVCPA